jgi:hypothetical protein
MTDLTWPDLLGLVALLAAGCVMVWLAGRN